MTLKRAATLLVFWLLATVVSSARTIVNPRNCGGAIHHVHVSVGPNSATSWIVSFASLSSHLVMTSPPVGGVLYGTSPDQLDRAVMENRQESPAFYQQSTRKNWGNDPEHSDIYHSPYYHHVLLTNLQPATTYYYQPIVQIDETAFFHVYPHAVPAANLSHYTAEAKIQAQKPLSPDPELEHRRHVKQWPPYNGANHECPSPTKIRQFTTGPPRTTIRATIAILGDLGQFPHSEETMERLLREKHAVDAAVLAGDIAYTGMDPRRWDTFFDFWDDYGAFDTIPLHICPGNHDIDKFEESFDIFLAYEHRFRMPRIQPPQLGVYDGPTGKLDMERTPYPLPYEYGNSYYSWHFGGAYFLMINAYSSMQPGSLQRRWINKQLHKINRMRDVYPWIVVVIHTPIYNTFGKHLHDEQMHNAKKHLEPLFVEQKVNLVFSGHIHAYQRTHNVALDQLDPRGPMHITVGAGGRACEAPFFQREPEEWIAVRDATMYGYGMFRVHNATMAEWEWIQTAQTDDDRDFNQLYKSEEHLPAGPKQDRVFIRNQYFVKED